MATEYEKNLAKQQGGCFDLLVYCLEECGYCGLDSFGLPQYHKCGLPTGHEGEHHCERCRRVVVIPLYPPIPNPTFNYIACYEDEEDGKRGYGATPHEARKALQEEEE